MKIELLASDFPVVDLQWNVRSHPELWNEHTARTKDPSSPHHGLDDIWLRFADSGGEMVSNPHDSVWYESSVVLEIRPAIRKIYERFGGTKLGGVLMTRIPPGATCKPHRDDGWHAREYEKIALQIESAPGQKFCFDDAELETRPGDVFWFDNSYTHWVINPTRYERVTLIVCMKR